MFKIEKNVPLPVSNGNYNCKYPFTEMEVGDSIYVMGVSRTSIMSYARSWCSKNSYKAAWYAVEEGQGVRLWRRR